MSPTPASTRRAAALFAVLIGCGGPDPQTQPTPEPPESPVAVAPANSAKPPVVPPPEGQARFQVSDGALTLIANAAPHRPLLAALAEQLDFVLVPGDVGIEPITLRLENVPLPGALAQLLPKRAYRVAYRFDSATRRHQVARLEVAPSGATRFVALPDYVVPKFVPDLGRPAAIGPGTTRKELLSPRAPRETSEPEHEWDALLLRLDDADATERIAALALIDPQGDGLPLIVERLAQDPDPRVRSAAAEKLEFVDTLTGVDALVSALRDPDKQVVLAAIDALEFSDDYSVTEDLAPLLQHSDSDIREAAAEAIDFIGSPDEE